MNGVARFWQSLTEGHSLGTLWLDFRREARSSFESSAASLGPGGKDAHGWRRVWAFARAMFFRLTPARRVLLLVAIVLVLSYDVERQNGQNTTVSRPGAPIAGAICLLVLLGLEVADRVALKRDLEVARDIQKWLVPASPPLLSGLDIAFRTRPANTVAGDYYDVIPMADEGDPPPVLFVVADVAGKGIPAGLLMACFRSCLRTLAGTTGNVAALVGGLNRLCCADSYQGRHYTTAFLARYDAATSTLLYINAGHNPPLLRRAAGGIEPLEAGGLPCGTFAHADYETGRAAIAPGDLLLIYTDGVVEAENESGAEYGFDRLRAFVEATHAPSAAFQQQLFDSIDAFTGAAPQHDDVTCMIVQFTG